MRYGFIHIFNVKGEHQPTGVGEHDTASSTRRQVRSSRVGYVRRSRLKDRTDYRGSSRG